MCGSFTPEASGCSGEPPPAPRTPAEWRRSAEPLAGRLTHGRGFGMGRNILVGVVGAVLGGFILRILGFSHAPGIVPELLTALLGSLAFLAILGQFAKPPRQR